MLVKVNDAPVANPDTLTATEDIPVTYTATQLLGNDTDVDGNPLTIASVTSGAGGTVTLNSNGTVTFTPGQTTQVVTVSGEHALSLLGFCELYHAKYLDIFY